MPIRCGLGLRGTGHNGFDAQRFHLTPEQPPITGAILRLQLKVRGGYFAGGVIGKAKQSQMGSAAFQPVVPAAIDQQQHPFLCPPLTPRAVLGGTPFLGRTNLLEPQNAPNTLPAQLQTLRPGSILMQMSVMEAPVFATPVRSPAAAPARRWRSPARVPHCHGEPIRHPPDHKRLSTASADAR